MKSLRFFRSVALLAALVVGVASAARAQTITINFDGLNAGDPASLAAPPGLSFHNSTFLPLLDQFGDPIPGSDFFQVDDSFDVARATNPLANNYGAAPSGSLALNALDQPVLLTFDVPTFVRSISFVLDGSAFGTPGGFPGYVYTDNLGTVLTTFNVIQDVPYLQILLTLDGTIQNLALPSGAFYDNFSVDVTPIPEPAIAGSLLGVLAMFGALAKRRRASRRTA